MSSSKITDIEKACLINCFPSSLRQDVETVISILPYERKILLVDGAFHEVSTLIFHDSHNFLLNNDALSIPYRMYFNEPSIEMEKLLNATQKNILNCIYLRHHNGFIRQKRLQELIDTTDDFVVPFTFQLLGEYVFEILEVLDKHINDRTLDVYCKFITENRKYWTQTESRMISYWNEYYRHPRFPKLKNYIGKQIVDRIKKRLQFQSPLVRGTNGA